MNQVKFCPECQKENKKSNIFVQQNYCNHALSDMGSDYYDENGNFIHVPRHWERCELTYKSYSCSNGHNWSEQG